MQVLLAPNSFRDALAAPEVAAAMARGARRVDPGGDGLRIEVVALPLADGGDGTLPVLAHLLDATFHTTTVSDPRGRPIEARFALADGGRRAILEMAEASGLRQLAEDERDPLRVDTRGTGELIRTALDHGARQILLGAGGSGTIDGGAGALAALGAVFRDADGRALEPHPAGLETLASIDLDGLDPRLAEAEVIVLGDVSTTLERHVAAYGRQKGASPRDFPALEANLHRLATLASERMAKAWVGVPWLGAAGCMAGGLALLAGAQVRPGAEEIIRHARFAEHLAEADLVVSGEGRLDVTSFEDKLPSKVATLAAEAGVPMVMVAGELRGERALPGVTASFSLAPGPGDLADAIAHTAERLADTTEQIVRLFHSAWRFPR